MYAERILIAGLALLGILFIAGGQQLAYRADIAFGPGFVPINAAAALVVACAIQAIRQRRKNKPVDDAHQPDYRTLAVAVAIMAAGAAAMSLGSVLGPILAITLLLSWLVSGHALWRSAVVAIAVTAMIYLIFVIWLGLPVG